MGRIQKIGLTNDQMVVSHGPRCNLLTVVNIIGNNDQFKVLNVTDGIMANERPVQIYDKPHYRRFLTWDDNVIYTYSVDSVTNKVHPVHKFSIGGMGVKSVAVLQGACWLAMQGNKLVKLAMPTSNVSKPGVQMPTFGENLGLAGNMQIVKVRGTQDNLMCLDAMGNLNILNPSTRRNVHVSIAPGNMMVRDFCIAGNHVWFITEPDKQICAVDISPYTTTTQEKM